MSIQRIIQRVNGTNLLKNLKTQGKSRLNKSQVLRLDTDNTLFYIDGVRLLKDQVVGVIVV